MRRRHQHTRRWQQLINALPQSPAENDSHKFLMQYIRSLSSEKITRLLHFMTGACVIAVDKVDIHFTNIVPTVSYVKSLTPYLLETLHLRWTLLKPNGAKLRPNGATCIVFDVVCYVCSKTLIFCSAFCPRTTRRPTVNYIRILILSRDVSFGGPLLEHNIQLIMS